MMAQNIKVYVRCRPLKEEEPLNTQLKVDKDKREVQLKEKTFTFDGVFDSETTQIEVYKKVLSPLIEQVLDGFNCTVFAYGQTGTGKTFTMEGEQTDESSDWQTDPLSGLIPRSFCQLFESLNGRDCTIRASFMELYNEELYDLLGSAKEITRLRMFDDPTRKGSVNISNLEEPIITTKDEIYGILRRGSAKRQTAATLLNACSSRSHTIFTITVCITDETLNGDEMVRIGKLNLVDLAGSESISRSGAVDRRAREATCINQSLLTLGRVITCLVSKASSHIPYRESKITRLLQDSLGGKTRTSIIATISPSSADSEDSLSTLEYAQRAKGITNKPEANKRINKKAFLRDYAAKIAQLQKDLKACIDKNGIYLDGESYNSMLTTLENHQKIMEVKEGQITAQIQKMQKMKDLFDGTTKMLNEKEQKLKHREKALQKFQCVAEESTKNATLLFDKVNRLKNVQETNKEKLEEFSEKFMENSDNLMEMIDCRIGQLQDDLNSLRESYQSREQSFLDMIEKQKQVIDQQQQLITNMAQHIETERTEFDKSITKMEENMEAFKSSVYRENHARTSEFQRLVKKMSKDSPTGKTPKKIIYNIQNISPEPEDVEL